MSLHTATLKLNVNLDPQSLKNKYQANEAGLKFVQDFEQKLIDLGDDKVRQVSLSFFKSGPEDYGHGDQFLGIKVPVLRSLMHSYLKLEQTKSLPVIHNLFCSHWHEIRFCALLILNELSTQHYKRYLVATKASGLNGASIIAQSATLTKSDVQNALFNICNFYLEHAFAINNWDLVDASAPQVIGYFLETISHIEQDLLLKDLALHSDLWVQRMALLSNLRLIRSGQFESLLKLVPIFLNAQHDLLHKALGWMLREVGKQDEQTLKDTLEQYGESLPRTTLRYAIERLNAQDKLYFMSLKKRVSQANKDQS